MKIGLIGPGIIEIPPNNWGAVEIIIWDYFLELTKQNHNVIIINKKRNNEYEQKNINSSYCLELIDEINNHNFDFIHIHYDILFHITNKLNCKKIGITSHYPYINNYKQMISDGFINIFNLMINQNKLINFVLANKDLEFLKENINNNNLLCKLDNGINSSLFNFSLNPLLKEKTIYLGKIDNRKKQFKYQNIDNIDFIGPINCHKFNSNNKNYLGIWTRTQVYSNLTNYSNLILLSDGEADPLVVKEALICGLGVVLNEFSSKNFKNEKFITVIPNDKLDDIEYIKKKIQENIDISINIRNEIRDFGINNFDISIVCNNYIKTINNL